MNCNTENVSVSRAALSRPFEGGTLTCTGRSAQEMGVLSVSDSGNLHLFSSFDVVRF